MDAFGIERIVKHPGRRRHGSRGEQASRDDAGLALRSRPDGSTAGGERGAEASEGEGGEGGAGGEARSREWHARMLDLLDGGAL